MGYDYLLPRYATDNIQSKVHKLLPTKIKDNF